MPQKTTPRLQAHMFKYMVTIAVACFALCSTSAHAIPKAAEHENAPVTTGNEMPRPKVSSKPAKIHATGKKKVEVKKERHDAKSTTKANTRK